MSPKLLYKQLLKVVDQNLTSVAGNTLWREHIAAAFRCNACLQDPDRIQEEVQLVQDYQHMVANIAQHQDLLLGYNIGLSEEERNKQMVEAVSRRVGFRLPKRHHEQSTVN